MYEIITSVDENEQRARQQAEAITDMPLDFEEVHVTILHSFTDNPSGASITQLGSVRRAKTILEDAGVDVSLEEASCDPATAIVELADERDADLIVVGGRKRTPSGKLLFGSVSQSVILSSDQPVVVCPSETV